MFSPYLAQLRSGLAKRHVFASYLDFVVDKLNFLCKISLDCSLHAGGILAKLKKIVLKAKHKGISTKVVRSKKFALSNKARAELERSQKARLDMHVRAHCILFG